MTAVSPSDWVAFLSLGLGIGATVAALFVGWVDADYLLVDDWQPVRDRLLVEVANAKYDARTAVRDAAVSVAAIFTPEATR